MSKNVYVGSVPKEVAQLIIDAMEERVHALVDAHKHAEARDLLYDLKDIQDSLAKEEEE